MYRVYRIIIKHLATISELGILLWRKWLYASRSNHDKRANGGDLTREAFELPLDSQSAYSDVSSSHWAFTDINSFAKN